MSRELEPGEEFDGIVKKIMPFGAFVEVLPNLSGLLHISEIAHERIRAVTDVLKEGDVVDVKVLEVDSQGRVNLSKKQANIDGPPVISRRSENGKGSRQKKSWN